MFFLLLFTFVSIFICSFFTQNALYQCMCMCHGTGKETQVSYVTRRSCGVSLSLSLLHLFSHCLVMRFQNTVSVCVFAPASLSFVLMFAGSVHGSCYGFSPQFATHSCVSQALVALCGLPSRKENMTIRSCLSLLQVDVAVEDVDQFHEAVLMQFFISKPTDELMFTLLLQSQPSAVFTVQLA